VLLAEEVSWGGGVLIEEACRIEMTEAGGLKVTPRLARGTRRLGWEEESDVRRGVGEVVWYVQGDRRVGCRRQPIAAVRRVGAAPSMLKWFWGCGEGEVRRKT
jgi:hypothetical protein